MAILNSQVLEYAPQVLLAFLLPWFLRKVIIYHISPLKDIPGPFLARYTRLWHLREIWHGTFPKTNALLHRKYDVKWAIVRLSPNKYSIDDPAAVKLIYGSGSGFLKGPWYQASGVPGHPNIFNEPDTQKHAAMRRSIASAYTTTYLVQLESFVDNCTALLTRRFEEFARTQEYVDVPNLVQCFAFDVIGEMTFGKKFGFLETGKDEANIMGSLNDTLDFNARVGVYPELHTVLFMAKHFLTRASGGMMKVLAFGQEAVEARCKKPISDDSSTPMDVVTKLLVAHQENPTKITKQDVIDAGTTNVAAGTDTTGISISAVIYYLWNNSRYLHKLRNELENAEKRGALSSPITYEQGMALPYLQAVIKEALRVHPAAGLPQGRIVPEGGRTITGRFFKAGNVVGINAWAAHANREIFGADADHFNPERWLEAPEVVKPREAYYMTFGAGSRTCLGKNISSLELTKLIPELVRQFDFIPEFPAQPWKTKNAWFVKPVGWRCRVQRRGKGVDEVDGSWDDSYSCIPSLLAPGKELIRSMNK